MNEVTVNTTQLPEKFEDVASFAVLAQEKLKSVRAEISAIKRLKLAEDVLRQKTQEAQDIAEIKTRAEMRIGELTANMPTKPGARTDITSYATGTRLQTKEEALNKAGIRKQLASEYERMAKNSDVVEKALAEARENGDIVSRADILRKVKEKKREEQRKEKSERKAYKLGDEMPDEVCKLFAADICEGLPEIADESIDYIITDPPYPAEYIPLYGELSKVAARVLKPNGSLIVMCGQSYFPKVIDQLSKEMNYHWCMAYVTPGGQSPSLFQKRVNTFWKPVLWFTKGKYNGDYIGDVLKSPTNANDKRYHEWGQSLGGMKDIIEKFTDAGQLILDPFLGGGTTGVAAVTMGRKFIGTDIDKKNIDISMERIKESYQDARSKSRAD